MRNIFITLILIIGSINMVLANEIGLISVLGNSEESFQPDMASISVRIWGKGKSAKIAQEESQKYYSVLAAAINKHNIDKKDLKTSHLSINPEYTWNEKTKKNEHLGYISSQIISVTVKKITELGPFIDSLTSSKDVDLGGLSINSMHFDISKRADEEQRLLAKAVEDAQNKANILAKAAKVKIKGVHKIAPIENQSHRPPISFARSDVMMKSSASQPTEIHTGEIKLNSVVAIDFEIN